MSEMRRMQVEALTPQESNIILLPRSISKHKHAKEITDILRLFFS